MIKYELTEKEKGFILGIILNTRNDYLRRNKYSKVKYVELEKAEIIITDEMVEYNVIRGCDENLSDSELGNLFENSKIKKIIDRALTNKQRSVLFLYYCKNKKDKEIGQILNLKEDTARKIRNRALKMIRKMAEEENYERRYF